MSHAFEILKASPADAPALARLFDAYRTFYGCASNLPLAQSYLAARLNAVESAIFFCRPTLSAAAAGFTQLYPSFSSVSAGPIWILNDLYVDAAHRKKGIARLLVNAAYAHASATGAIRLELSTAKTNHLAQALYESLGYTVENGFLHYTLPVSQALSPVKRPQFTD